MIHQFLENWLKFSMKSNVQAHAFHALWKRWVSNRCFIFLEVDRVAAMAMSAFVSFGEERSLTTSGAIHSFPGLAMYIYLLNMDFEKLETYISYLGSTSIHNVFLGEYAQLVSRNDSTAVFCRSLQRNQKDQSSKIYPQHLKKQGLNMLPYYSFLKKSW